MTPSDQDIKEIAGTLECGMVCYYHVLTGEIIDHPDPDGLYFEPEGWEEVMDRVEQEQEQLIQFEPMNSREGYMMMERFAENLDDEDFKNKLLQALNRKGPFRHFKGTVDHSPFREDWFAFKSQAYRDWVKAQLSDYADE